MVFSSCLTFIKVASRESQDCDLVTLMQPCNSTFLKKIVVVKMRPTLILRSQILNVAHAVDRQRERLLRKRRRRRQGALLRANIDAFDVPDREFIKHFRLTKELTKRVIEDLTPLLRPARRSDGVSVESKVLTALAFYATGSYQTPVGAGSLLNLSQPSVSRAVREVTDGLNAIYHKYVVWPANRQARNHIKAQFYNKFGIPGVVGVIDGTHVAILGPSVHEERYVNRKGFHSLNAMIICDADLNVLCVDASLPGNTHDATVWQNHPLCQHLTELENSGEQIFLLGDSGYPLRPTMITPILNATVGTPEYHFYQKQVTARNTVERCIGVLKSRFRCLLAARELHYDPITAGKIVNACCVLHNIANSHGVPVEPLSAEEAAADAEYSRRAQAEQQLRSEAASALNTQNLQNQRRVNIDLQRGRALQQALVAGLWRSRV